MAKRSKQAKLLEKLSGEEGFYLKTIEICFRQKACLPFSVLRKKEKFLVLPASLLSSALHSSPCSPSSHFSLKNCSQGFASLFSFSRQKMYCYSVNVFVLSYFADDFLPIFGGLNLPLVTLFAPLWSPLRRLTLSLKKLGQGQTTAWLWTLTSL